jgi:hypothetical protein
MIRPLRNTTVQNTGVHNIPTRKSRRGVVIAVIASLVVLVFATVPAARACLNDAVGLTLFDGELPGGG